MASSHNATLTPLIRGDTEEFSVTIQNKNGTPRDISTDLLVFEARINKNDTVPLIRKTSEDVQEITKDDPVGGLATVHIEKEDTLPLTVSKTLSCTMSVIDTSGRPNTIIFKVPVTYRTV